jgi:hypothetical protein
MKVYVLCHSWLSPIAKGIQGAHAVAELVSRWDETVLAWADNHKTLIFLEGGNQANLSEWLERLEDLFPTSCFYEDKDSLNSCLTAVAFLVDEDTIKNMEHWKAGRNNCIRADPDTLNIIYDLCNLRLAS